MCVRAGRSQNSNLRAPIGQASAGFRERYRNAEADSSQVSCYLEWHRQSGSSRLQSCPPTSSSLIRPSKRVPTASNSTGGLSKLYTREQAARGLQSPGHALRRRVATSAHTHAGRGRECECDRLFPASQILRARDEVSAHAAWPLRVRRPKPHARRRHRPLLHESAERELTAGVVTSHGSQKSKLGKSDNRRVPVRYGAGIGRRR